MVKDPPISERNKRQLITEENRSKRAALVSYYNKARSKASRLKRYKVLMEHETYLHEVNQNG